MDNEAGLEHLSRRTAYRIDHLIVVVNDSRLSIDCAGRICHLIDGLGNDVRRRHYLVNAAREDRLEDIAQRMSGLGLEFLGVVPRDEDIEQAIANGQPLSQTGDGPAVSAVREIVKSMIGAG
jgi:CO dehydrogenase maturation factor